jgi:predicted nucleic-acid-binding Zn-ribbon protein
MPLSEDQIETVQNHFRRLNIDVTCYACNTSKWSLGEIVASPGFSGGNIALGGPIVPLVQVICERCGYAMHFAAKLVGLVG